MKVIKEELISFETAKLAREKGFKKIGGYMGFVDKFYHPRTGTLLSMGRTGKTDFKSLYYAPTQSFFQKWLREIHHINIDIFSDTNKHLYFLSVINAYQSNDTTTVIRDEKGFIKEFESYEQALEEGLQKALNLIPDGPF